MSYVGIATGEGGRLRGGRRQLSLDTPGYFMQPTVIADTDPGMRINCEEVFGPVARPCGRRTTPRRSSSPIAASSGFRPGSSPTTRKLIRDFRRRIRAGMVMVNLPTAGVDYHVPFGGHPRIELRPREQGFAAVRILHPDQRQFTRGVEALAEGIIKPVAQGAVYPSLAGKRVIVRGGDRGSARESSRRSPARARRWRSSTSRTTTSEALVARLADAAIAPLFVHCDIRDCADDGRQDRQDRRKLGGCDVLVNNAANDDRHQVEEVTPAYWDERWRSISSTSFFARKAVLPAMKEAGGGSIVNLGSISWHLGLPT